MVRGPRNAYIYIYIYMHICMIINRVEKVYTSDNRTVCFVGALCKSETANVAYMVIFIMV